MCGITGVWPRSRAAEARSAISAMVRAMRLRGPDDSGEWSDGSVGICLGHTRLAVVDLSASGHQPMLSACNRYVIVFNGEIYNHLDLREAMPSQHWRGHSDTETLLACISLYGILETLNRLVGMFAFAVWDRLERQLTLARDRMGEKPLYFGRLACGDFVFASELKALRLHPQWSGEIDRESITLLLRHNCIPAPRSVYRGIQKLRAGTILTISADGSERLDTYWDLAEVARRAKQQTGELTDELATDRLESLLKQSVEHQMLSDVPLGAFLSGGIDSSTVVALMSARSTRKVRTFSVGFDESGFDEAVHAKAVAAHLGTHHTELYVTAADALAVIPRLASIYDEPFADASQIPTSLVCQLARRHVTVALSGDGGDELFAGYTRYKLAGRTWGRLSALPLGFRRGCSDIMLSVSPSAWQSAAGFAMRFAPKRKRIGNVGEKIHKFAADVLPAESRWEMYRALVSHWSSPSSVVLGAEEPMTLMQDPRLQPVSFDPVERMSLIDQLTYLPDDILVKVDRAAMGVSLETRIPLLDHRIVEFAWRTPMHQKIRDGQSKWLLRQVLYRHVPRALVERPKQGFSVPLAEWLRGPLRGWAEHLLDPVRLRRESMFDTKSIRSKWEEHLSGRRNWQYLLWNVLMFQAWHESIDESEPATRLAA